MNDPTIDDVLGYDAHAVYVDQLVPNPPAGKDWSFTVPGGFWFRLRAGTATLKISSQAGERGKPEWQVKDGAGNVRARGMPLSEIIIAPRTYTIFYDPSYNIGNNEGIFTRPVHVPDIWIPPGWSVGSFTFDQTNGLQSEDQYSGIRLWAQMPLDTAHEAMPERHEHESRRLAYR